MFTEREASTLQSMSDKVNMTSPNVEQFVGAEQRYMLDMLIKSMGYINNLLQAVEAMQTNEVSYRAAIADVVSTNKEDTLLLKEFVAGIRAGIRAAPVKK